MEQSHSTSGDQGGMTMEQSSSTRRSGRNLNDDGTEPLYPEIQAERRWNRATLPEDPGEMTMDQSHFIQLNEPYIWFDDRMNYKLRFLCLFKHEIQVEITYLHFLKVSLIKMSWVKEIICSM